MAINSETERSEIWVGRRLHLLLLALIVVAALFLRLYRLERVPPGVHYDELLNGEIAEQALREGPKIFYDTSGGREGLYHLVLTGSMALPLPVAWQLRLPSVLFSVIGLLFSYLWVARAFGRWAALATLGLMAVSFWTVWMGRAALRVGTVTAVAATAAFLLTGLLRFDGKSSKALLPQSLALGVVLGLSFYTYRAGSMTFLLFVVYAVYLSICHREQARKLALPLVLAIVVALPMILVFATIPGADPRFGQIALPWQSLVHGDPVPALKGLLDNLGMFFWRGDMEGHYNLPGRPHFEALGATLFVAGLGLALWRWRQSLYALCLLWLGVGLLPGIFTVPAPSFVHTVSAQGITYVFPGIAVAGVHQYIRRKKSDEWASFLTAATVLSITLINGAWTFRDYFIRWPEVQEVRDFHQADLALIAADLDDMEAGKPVAICSSVLNEGDSFWRSGRQSIRFMLNRDDLAIRWYDCGSAQVLPDSDDTALLYFPNDSSPGAWMEAPEGGALSAAELSIDVTRLNVDVGQWRQALLMDLAGPSGKGGAVQFGSEMAFLGYRLDQSVVPAGEEIELLTFWQVTAPLPADLSVFVHLLDDGDKLVAQGDSFSALSDTLLPGDVVIQLHRFVAPHGTASGQYPLSVGVYSRTGQHPPLPVVLDGQEQNARLELQTLEILAQP